jgi:hypothetical protein
MRENMADMGWPEMRSKEVGVWERDGAGWVGEVGWWRRMLEEVSIDATRASPC